MLLTRSDPYAQGAPPVLMLWQKIDLFRSPLFHLGGAMRLGQLWASLRELWWSGHPDILWQRCDGTRVIGPAAHSILQITVRTCLPFKFLTHPT